MKIEIPRKAYLGDIEIKPGEYLVTISPESNKIVLVGAGGEIKLPAVRRPAKCMTCPAVRCSGQVMFSGK